MAIPAAPFLRTHPSDAALRAMVRGIQTRPINYLRSFPSDAAGRVAGVSKPIVVAPVRTTASAAPASDITSYLQSLFGTPLTLEQMTAAAQKQAQADIAAIVNPYLLSEQRAAERAAATAAQIRDASQAVATSLQPLGDVTHQDYQDALTQLRQFSQGFQGQIGQDAQAEAAAAQAQFDKMNAPATATNLGGDLGNVLYATGGVIPASPLASAGIAQTMAARNLPGQVLAGGQQQVLQQQQAYANQVQDIEDKIAAAQGQLPTLTQQYLQNFQTQARDDLSSRIALLNASKPEIVGSAAAGYRAVNPFTGVPYPGYVIPPDPRAAGAAAAAPFSTRTIVIGKNRDGLVTFRTNKVTGQVTMVVNQQPSDAVISPKLTTVNGVAGVLSVNKAGKPIFTPASGAPAKVIKPTVTTVNGVPGIITVGKNGQPVFTPASGDLPPKTEFHSLGRGGYVVISIDQKTGVPTVTDQKTGVPLPVDRIRNSDGTYTVIGYNPKTGKPFTLTVGTPTVIAPIIRANPTGGYDVFDGKTGGLLRHVVGDVLPKIISTPRTGGWDVADATTGRKLYHVDGPPQTKAAATNLGVAYGRVNSIAANAVNYTPAKGFTTDTAGTNKVIVGSEKPAAPFIVSIEKALKVAPQTKNGQAAAVGIISSAYKPLIDAITQFLASPRISKEIGNLKGAMDQAIASGNRADWERVEQLKQGEAAKLLAWGTQAGLPSDLLQPMIESALHTNALGGYGVRFPNPVDAANSYMNLVLDNIPKEFRAATTTAATTGGGSPFGTSNVPGLLQTAILAASQKYSIDPNLMVALWTKESGAKYPNNFANGLGYGGLFGTRVTSAWGTADQTKRVNAGTPMDQAMTAAKILRTQLDKHGGDMSKALLAYSGGGYNSLDYTPTAMDPSQVKITTEGKPTQLTRNAVQLVRTYLGTPYVWAGENPGGFDCSGLLQYVWGKQGVSIPRTTYDQWSTQPDPSIGYAGSVAVDKANLMPGDAVFFTGADPQNGKPGHVGMYIGGGRFIEAPGRGGHVQISFLSNRSDYVGARRFRYA